MTDGGLGRTGCGRGDGAPRGALLGIALVLASAGGVEPARAAGAEGEPSRDAPSEPAPGATSPTAGKGVTRPRPRRPGPGSVVLVSGYAVGVAGAVLAIDGLVQAGRYGGTARADLYDAAAGRFYAGGVIAAAGLACVLAGLPLLRRDLDRAATLSVGPGGIAVTGRF